LDGNSGLDWVVVGSDVLLSHQVPCGSIVKDSLLHLQPVRIGVESVLVVQVWTGPGYNYLLANIREGNTVQDYLPLSDLKSLEELDFDNSRGIVSLVVKIKSQSLDH
jgi:hypothetical protein